MSQSQGGNGLFPAVQGSGVLTGASLQTLTVRNPGRKIQQAMYTPVLDYPYSEVVLLGTVLDDSSSIEYFNNTQAIRDGYNRFIGAMRGAAKAGSVQAHAILLNDGPLHAFCPIEQAVLLDQSNYRPHNGTPLFDRTREMLETLVEQIEAFLGEGVDVRTLSLIVTDGADTGSRTRVSDLRQVIQDLVKTERHIVGAMGVKGEEVDFDQVFAELGIPPRWRLQVDGNDKSIRAAFEMPSQVFSTASKSSASQSAVAGGGFAQP